MVILIFLLFIFLIIWITSIPSGKLFLRQSIKSSKKLTRAKRKIIAFGNFVIQNNNFNKNYTFTTITTIDDLNPTA